MTRRTHRLAGALAGAWALVHLCVLAAMVPAGFGATVFTRVTEGPIVTNGGSSHGCSWGDYDGDGHLDLVVAYHAGQDLLVGRNNGDGTFTKITNGVEENSRGNAYGCIWGDYDNDGHLDLFVCNFGTNFLQRSNGDGTFTRVESGHSFAVDVAESTACAWADFDNDGYLDLFVANFRGLNFLYRNEGNGTFTRVRGEPLAEDPGNSAGSAWGDYNGDGALDLYVTNHGRDNFLYRNNGNSNNWLAVDCLGNASNRSGIGAKVRLNYRVDGTEASQLRQVSGGDSVSGGSLWVHFGLGAVPVVETLRVEWPSGIVQELHSVQVNRRITVTEPAVALSHPAATDDRIEFQITARRGQRVRVEFSEDLSEWALLRTVTNDLGRVLIVDSDLPPLSRRFYRGVIE